MKNYNEYPSFGLDTKVKLMQNALAQHLGFENIDLYGRVLKVIPKDTKANNNSKFVAEVHISGKDRKEVYYDDAKAPGGNIFFVEAEDEHKTKDQKLFTAKVKVVFMLNLDKLLGAKNYRADGEIQDYCMKLIQKLKIMQVTGIEKGIKNVLADFDTTKLVKQDLQPYHTFSINGNMNYYFNCTT